MERIISVDSGKSHTKFDVVRANGIYENIFPTKVDEVDINEEPEEGTYIAIVNDKAYRVGANAVTTAPKSTTKMTLHHQIATWTTLALHVDSGDAVNAAIGCPLSLFENTEKKNQYKDFILPKDEIDIKIKTVNGIQSKHFRIGKRLVAPEGSGIIFQNPSYFANKIVAVIDIGGLNFQAAIYENCSLQHDRWFTKNFGGRVFIDKLTADINSEFSTDFDTKIIENKMFMEPAENRFIRVEGDNSVREKSMEFIKEELNQYTKEIFKQCKEGGIDPLNMETWLVGGTASLISENVKMLYGDEIHIATDPDRVNARGWCEALKKLA